MFSKILTLKAEDRVIETHSNKGATRLADGDPK